MGFDFHITRAEHWLENQGKEISKQEWLALVSEDPELTPDPSNGECAVLWATTSASGDGSTDSPWFDWYDGCVFTSDPDQTVLAKMVEIAERLRAKVEDDDGVHYEPAKS